MKPEPLPIARELFAQWRRARGDRSDPATRPFSRGWEELLADAGLHSATERCEAERDAQALAADGWVELKSVRYRPHGIDRITVPLAQENRWRAAFGFTPPSDDNARQVRDYPWQPELAFLPTARLGLSFDELRRLNDFLARGGRRRPLVPLYERSLDLFGDEKRLDQLYRGSALFAEGRLSLDLLRCFAVSEPLGWKRGAAKDGPVIVIENLATWDTYGRWNEQTPQFSAVVYGGGYRFVESVSSLVELFRELGGVRRVCYFGDLDADGLEIPQRADRKASRLGLPAIEPHRDSYRWLLEFAEGVLEPERRVDAREPLSQDPVPRGPVQRPDLPPVVAAPSSALRDDGASVCPDTAAAVSVDRSLCTWLGELADAAWAVLARGGRLAQENIGWEFLEQRLSRPTP
jgi:hypothetical protein